MAHRCLNAAASIDPEDANVHEQAVAFRNMLNSTPDLPPKVSEVLKAEFKLMDASASPKKYNEDFQTKHSESTRHNVAAIKAKRILGEDRGKCEKELAGLLSLKAITFDEAAEILEMLRSWRSPEREGFQQAASAKWPESTRLA